MYMRITLLNLGIVYFYFYFFEDIFPLKDREEMSFRKNEDLIVQSVIIKVLKNQYVLGEPK